MVEGVGGGEGGRGVDFGWVSVLLQLSVPLQLVTSVLLASDNEKNETLEQVR